MSAGSERSADLLSANFGQFFNLLRTISYESLERIGGGGVEREISEAFIARCDFRDAGWQEVLRAEGLAGEVNRRVGFAGRVGAGAGVKEKPYVRRCYSDLIFWRSGDPWYRLTGCGRWRNPRLIFRAFPDSLGEFPDCAADRRNSK